MGRKDKVKQRTSNHQRGCVAVGECQPPHIGSKDTRHYCKGKVGVEHQWRWMRCADIPNESWYHKRRGNTVNTERLICIVCMKIGSGSRERCACCSAILSASTPPDWMKVPSETHGVVKITREEVIA